MNKPKNYDNTTLGFVPVELGGHTAIIKNVTERKSSKGQDMIVVSIEFANDDRQPGYFQNLYDSDTRKDKKWPAAGTSYILVNDNDGNTNRVFKQFTTAFEESNGREVIWGGDAWGKQFTGRRIGVIYRIEENFYNDELREQHKIFRFCDVKKAPTADVPNPKRWKGATTASTESSDDWMTPPDADDDTFPFR